MKFFHRIYLNIDKKDDRLRDAASAEWRAMMVHTSEEPGRALNHGESVLRLDGKALRTTALLALLEPLSDDKGLTHLGDLVTLGVEAMKTRIVMAVLRDYLTDCENQADVEKAKKEIKETLRFYRDRGMLPKA